MHRGRRTRRWTFLRGEGRLQVFELAEHPHSGEGLFGRGCFEFARPLALVRQGEQAHGVIPGCQVPLCISDTTLPTLRIAFPNTSSASKATPMSLFANPNLMPHARASTGTAPDSMLLFERMPIRVLPLPA